MLPPIHLRCLISLLIHHRPNPLSICVDVLFYCAPLFRHLGMLEHACFYVCDHFGLPKNFYPPWSLLSSFSSVSLPCWLFFDIGQCLVPPTKCKVMTESSLYLFVWVHFDHVLSYVVILINLFTMFILPSPVVMARTQSPCPFLLMYFVVFIHCSIVWEFLGTYVFGHVLILAFPGVNFPCIHA